VGEDGPTHQPVEQIASLRAIPNLVVVRPADANEVRVAWQIALERRDGPTALVLTRQGLPTLERGAGGVAGADEVRRGGYVLADTGASPDIILIATGSEVQLALEVRRRLVDDGVAARVVNMASWELFEEQAPAYRAEVLPADVPCRLAIEAAATMGWSRYVGSAGDIVGIDRFGASAPGSVTLEKLGFTVEEIERRARALLARD
jgi:transketolase